MTPEKIHQLGIEAYAMQRFASKIYSRIKNRSSNLLLGKGTRKVTSVRLVGSLTDLADFHHKRLKLNPQKLAEVVAAEINLLKRMAEQKTKEKNTSSQSKPRNTDP